MPPPLLEPVATLRRYLGEHPAHAHEHVQLLFGLQGRLELEVAGRAAAVEPGAGLVVPPGALHAYDAAREARVWVIDAPADPALGRLRSFALPPGWRPPADALAALDALVLASAAPRLRARRRLDPLRLERALFGRLHEPWPTTRMAALYALSPPRFHARWLALTGLAPQAWLRARRLDSAAVWLKGGLTLEAAALQVGYASASALAFALRRERGLGARRLRSPASR
jgi:AraC-like DNA-binding protein